VNQQLHTDVLFIMLQGLLDQCVRGKITYFQLTTETLPIYKKITRQYAEQCAAIKREVSSTREVLMTENATIKSLRSLLFEHMDFIDHMDLRKEYNDFCLSQIKKERQS
jgi:hypothetical protein